MSVPKSVALGETKGGFIDTLALVRTRREYNYVRAMGASKSFQFDWEVKRAYRKARARCRYYSRMG